jgi:hypothetical protein
MSYTPYLSVAEFEVYTGGIGIPSDLSEPELNQLLINASTTVDAYCGTSFQFKSITEEIHDFVDREEGMNIGWEVYPYNFPIRTLSQFFIAVGMDQDGNFTGADIPITPLRPTTGLPKAFGTVFVDRERGFLQTSYSMLNFGVGIFRLFPQSIQPVSVVISYTSGYDDGTETDGISIPMPQWLKEGTRAIASNMLMLRNLYSPNAFGIGGMGGIQSASVGDVRITRFHPSRTKEIAWGSIPDEAKDILKPHRYKTGVMV